MDEKLIDGATALAEKQSRVIKIEPAERPQNVRLRVAAYTRVSSDSEDQLNSFAAQNRYYTELISSKAEWRMVDIYADEGISGTSVAKRDDFQRMMADCRRGLIDQILVKSISRFARNTKDCLQNIRELKELGVNVRFEREGIDTVNVSSELITAIYAAFAQKESESISGNMQWSYQRRMESGEFNTCKAPWGFRLDGRKLKICEPEADIVQRIFREYLSGKNPQEIADDLNASCLTERVWNYKAVDYILQNERYAGNALLQKRYTPDMLSRQQKTNHGEREMYFVPGSNDAIISPELFERAQVLRQKRSLGKAPVHSEIISQIRCICGARMRFKNVNSKWYALSERLVCGECGTLYRRCTWTRNGEKRVVWRCVSRLDYGKKYCHNSPTLDEAPLQQAILAALNTAMADKNSLIRQITDAMETEIIPFPGGTMSLGDIERRLRELEQQFQTLLEKATNDPAAYGGQFKEILDEQTFLKEKRSVILANNNEQTKANQRIMDAAQTLENASLHITEWDESAVRQLVETVKILSKDEVAVTLKGGIEICQKIMY